MTLQEGMILTVENSDSSSPVVTGAGIALVVGGACWVVKGVAILISGVQPPVLFEIAPIFFIVGLLGLRARLGSRGGRTATAGGACLALAALLSVATWLLSVADDGPGSSRSSENEFQPTLLLAFIALLAGLTLLGLATRWTQVLGDRWSALPLALVVAAPVMMIAGGGLEAINERLLEIPLVMYGLGWMGLGYALIRSVRRPSPAVRIGVG